MQILRLVAFSTDPAGGNPAGVVLDAGTLTTSQMQTIAADVGFSETAFLAPRADGELDVRYFSPLAEVPFCGHATIASAVAHTDRAGQGAVVFHTAAGAVPVTTTRHAEGTTATLVSVPPSSEAMDDDDRAALLTALRWPAEDLDAALPIRVAYAGARHPVVAANSRARLADLDYDVEALTDLMRARDWTTIQLVWRESETVFHSRNPFPPGGVYEDPATGAAAAALGGYLRELALVPLPATVTIHQGVDLGRPGLIEVGISRDPSEGISVTGSAVTIDGA